jgi:hypothetical protein
VLYLSTLKKESGFKVIDTRGITMLQGGVSLNNKTINIKDVPAGTYILELSDDDGTNLTRFIKE